MQKKTTQNTKYKGWMIEHNGSHTFITTSPDGKQQLLDDTLRGIKAQIDLVIKAAS